MDDGAFDRIERQVAEKGAIEALVQLESDFREQKNYPMVFETRLMRKRIELGLPPIGDGSPDDPPPQLRKAYEEGFLDAARETGALFLADGQIARAWPYFRALGETRPIAEAIETQDPSEECDSVIEIAFQERVNPRKGFELILSRHGLCRAITFFGQY